MFVAIEQAIEIVLELAKGNTLDEDTDEEEREFANSVALDLLEEHATNGDESNNRPSSRTTKKKKKSQSQHQTVL